MISRFSWIVIAAICVLLPAPVVEASSLGRPNRDSSLTGDILTLSPLTVSIFRNNRVVGALSVEVSIKIDPKKLTNIEVALPILRDRYITSLMRYAANRVDVTRPLNLGELHRVLQTITDEVLADNTGKLLIGTAVVRRI